MNCFPQRIVLLANMKVIPHAGYKKYMSSFDISKYITNHFIANAIKKSGFKLIWYSNHYDFVKNIASHKSDLVFPYYHGIASKIRQSFVQTICEDYDIKFVGADAYSLTVTNDKALSKEICRHSGIETPNCKIFFDQEYPPDIIPLKLPLIIKPQFEADSIGITQSSVCYSYEKALLHATKLFNELRQPIIIEEYIEGKEISINIVGYKRIIKKIEALEYVKNKSQVYTYRNKKYSIRLDQYKNANDQLKESLFNNTINLFHALDKMEFMRLDFILKDEIAYNIELTADPALSPFSCIYSSFKKEMNYNQFINFLISNCIERYKNE